LGNSKSFGCEARFAQSGRPGQPREVIFAGRLTSFSGSNARARAGVFDDSLAPVGHITQLNDPTDIGRFSLSAGTAFGMGADDTLFAAWNAQASDGTNHALRGRALVVPRGGFA